MRNGIRLPTIGRFNFQFLIAHWPLKNRVSLRNQIMKILSALQMYQLDKATMENRPISSIDLMEYAATQCYHWIIDYLKLEKPTIHIFSGSGNNGGDGLVIARKLLNAGYKVIPYFIVLGNKRSKDFEINYNRLTDLNYEPSKLITKQKFPKIGANDLVIDAIFGIGLSRTPDGFVKEVIQLINKSKTRVISIDVPSGMFTEMPVLDEDSVIKATETLTFQNPKLAFLLPENQFFCGSWHILDIGLDKEVLDSFSVKYKMVDKNYIRSLFKKRNKFSHKGNYGHSMIIGGSFGKIGAVVLASRAALRAGSGLVSAYIPKCGYDILQSTNPEVMVEVDAEDHLEFFNYKTKPSVIGIGMGLGTREKTSIGFGKFLMENELPLVIDADGLNIIARHREFFKLIPENSILTPHPKEFERLVGKWKNDYEKLEKLIDLSIKINCIVILKGAHTAIAHNGEIYFNTTGNPALATAGSGDVLTGIITGLLAQDYTSNAASILGVYLHGLTADIAISKSQTMESFIASDSIKNLANAFNKI